MTEEQIQELVKSKKPEQVYLFTNRNCLIFDQNGNQIPELQAAISCYVVQKELARAIAFAADEFFIAEFNNWSHPISRFSFMYLLGIRTEEDDRK